MTETNPGDIIYLTKRAKTIGAIVKVQVTSKPGAFSPAKTNSSLAPEKFAWVGSFARTEEEARDKA